jgi:hypothetical protein
MVTRFVGVDAVALVLESPDRVDRRVVREFH